MGKKISKCLGIVIGVTIFCIVLHIYLPEDATSSSFEFDSGLVKAFGFPAVMSFYFFMFFLQLYFAFNYLIKKSMIPKKSSAIRLAIGFTLVPLMAMPEIAPGTLWTPKVTFYQFILGLGDALPVTLLAILIYQFCIHKSMKTNNNTYKQIHLQRRSKVLLTLTVAAAFIVERIICYITGITLSAMKEYPVPCIVWTVVFGITLGIVCTILYPVYHSNVNDRKHSSILMFLTLGLNWIWFNNFIAMIAKDMVIQMTTRSVIDVLVVIGCVLAVKGMICYEEV